MDNEIEDYFKNIKTDEVCRTCLSASEEMISLYSELEDSDDELTHIHHVFTSVTSIQVEKNDGLPVLICKNCNENLNTAFQFKILSQKSAHLLKTYLSKVKQQAILKDINIKEQNIANDHDYIIKYEPKDEKNTVKNKNESVKSADPDEDYDTDGCAEDVEVLEDEFQTENSNLSTTNMITSDKVIVQLHESEESSIQEIVTNRKLSDSKNVDNSDKPIAKSTKQKTKQSKPQKRKANYYDFYINDDGVKMFKCKDCDKEYKYAANLTIHIRSHTDERPYECKICSKKFRQITSLKHHMRCHTGETPYECELCGKRYRQSCSLTAHMRIHTGQRPFVCSVCNKGFRQKPDLRYHMRTHTKEKPYMCSICGKCMSMQCHLVQHMRTHTGEKPFSCKVCEKSFPSSTRLRRHEVIHSDERPFVCEICTKTFNRLNTLKIHALTHTGIKPHTCHVCNKSFVQKHGLKNHLLTHLECESQEEPIKKKVVIIDTIDTEIINV